MPSLQNSAPGAKSMKFADPLNPFTPFLAQPHGDEPVEEDLSPLTEQFDDRIRLDRPSAVATAGAKQQPNSLSSYASCDRTFQNQPVQNISRCGTSKSNATCFDRPSSPNNNEDVDENSNDDDDENSDFEYDDDDDAVLEAIRQKRLRELRKDQIKNAENKAKGHGEVRTISQDEFLSECCECSSAFVAVHFFHKEFERCKIMDHHLKKIAPQHLSCKFLRIDAEKAPFFVVKLKVKTLPTLIVFKNGETIDRLLGFEDLTNGSTSDPDDFPTCHLGYWLEKTGAIEYVGPDSDDEDENHGRLRRSAPRRMNRGIRVYDEEA